MGELSSLGEKKMQSKTASSSAPTRGLVCDSTPFVLEENISSLYPTLLKLIRILIPKIYNGDFFVIHILVKVPPKITFFIYQGVRMESDLIKS